MTTATLTETVPINKVVSLYLKGLSQVEIAEYCNVKKQTIHERLRPYREDLDGLKEYKSDKADLIAQVEGKGYSCTENVDQMTITASA
jgi:predicted DNA-binding protein YlxM (UPF0122 family)